MIFLGSERILFRPLGETLVCILALAIPLVAIFGKPLVSAETADKDFHFNQRIGKGGVFFAVLRISADESVNTFGRSRTAFPAGRFETMLTAEFCVALLVSDCLQSHQINVDELELVQQVSANGLGEVESGVVSHYILDPVELAQVADNGQGFGFGDNRSHFTLCQPFGVDGEILLGVVIVADFIEKLHHQQGSGGQNVAVLVMDSTADVVKSLGMVDTTNGCSGRRAGDSLVDFYRWR